MPSVEGVQLQILDGDPSLSFAFLETYAKRRLRSNFSDAALVVLEPDMDEGFHDTLLNMFSKAVVEAVRRRHKGRVGGNRCTDQNEEEEEEEEEEEVKMNRGGEAWMSSPAETRRITDEDHKVLSALRKLTEFYSDRVNEWRDVVRTCTCMSSECPAEGDVQPPPALTDCTECSFKEVFLSVEDDIEGILDKLNAIIITLDAQIHQGSAVETRGTSASPADPDPDPDPDPDSEPRPETQDGGDRTDVGNPSDSPHTGQTPDSEQQTQVKGQGEGDEDCGSVERQTDHVDNEEDSKRRDDERSEETNTTWITVGLPGQLDGGRSYVPDVVFIRAATGVPDVLRCEVVDVLSFLMVSGCEELVSRVIRVRVRPGARVRFPLAVLLPFGARYRGNYRDVAVKMVDAERRVSYMSPVTTEGSYGGQRGSFAEVRVYSLGLFAVVSCLKRESYTVPRRGLSFKLPMDPRICLNYLPGSFTAPVMVQVTIQPLDAVLLAAVKSSSDVYRSVVSSSPMLYLTHPASQPLRRTLTLTLPCPPNPKKKGAGHVEEPAPGNTRSVSGSPSWDQHGTNRVRALGESVKSSQDVSNELLMLLGSRDKEWSVMEKVTVRNQQKGLVSLELTENVDRLLVVRLLSPLLPCHLVSLAEELQEAVYRHAVTVVLQRQKDDPHAVLVAALPSRDLSWELSKLQAQGFSGPLDASVEVPMCEGDQLLLRFSGNITSTGAHKNQNDVPPERLTFHSQRRTHILVRLTEVDPFGNHSSHHYKGTAMFYKVTRGQLDWNGDHVIPIDVKLLGDPVCKLPLTLPKKVRIINRPIIARVKLCEDTTHFLSDSVLLWLSTQLSEDDVSLLVTSLRLRRSAAQLVKLRAGDSPSSQAFHVLAMWRRGLPAAPPLQHNVSQLANCLAKSGRPDLGRELLLRQAAASTQASLK